ncbi:hypothetical protein A0H81_01521 [Grifola frondosa]|uniref:Uncharacterized protein n=1 Tax=Grifola frondosa TaxID=5627 RepID=A0A1C7MRS0_GRIFR|nr:hypothetical protein A0H81_01521 [Grifola frondosa]
MITWAAIFRALQAIAVPLLFAWVARHFAGNQKESTPPSLYLPMLTDIGFVPRSFPVTYRTDAPEFEDYTRVATVQNLTASPDTTAVILNWSRFPNVLLITSLLCGSWLEDTIAEVFIWNNSPRKLRYDDFKNTGCPKRKLRIHNAPANMYFQARFIACALAETPNCFIQDDDYLIRSEIIKSLHARITDHGSSPAIHLLPPHEHLSSSLSEIHVPARDTAYLSDVHTSFAWLGYGTMLRRAEMADNYFTILSNRVPEIWFDQGFELGGGQAFTAGPEGDERNAKYIHKATQYLSALVHCGRSSCNLPEGDDIVVHAKVPYISLDSAYSPTAWTRAACRGSACVLETNIRLLPESISHSGEDAEDILSLVKRNLETLGEARKQEYIEQPPSYAVDSVPATSFRSPRPAKMGDTFGLDSLTDISDAREWTAVEMAWLIDPDTENILNACAFEWSTDNVTWHSSPHRPVCDNTAMEIPSAGGEQRHLRECSARMVLASVEFI